MSDDRDLSGLTEAPKRKDRQINRSPPRRPRPRAREQPTEPNEATSATENRAADGRGEGNPPAALTTESNTDDSETTQGTVESVSREPSQESTSPLLAVDDERVVKKNMSIAASLRTRLEEATAAERLSYGELVLDAVDRYGDRLHLELTDEDRHWFTRRRRRRRRGSGVRTVIGAYLTPTEWARVDRLASNVGMDRSTFVAEVVRRRLGLSREEAHSG